MSDTLIPHSNTSVPAVRLALFDSAGALRDIGSAYPLTTLSVEHLRTHEGRMFSAGYLWDSANKVANAAFADIAFTTSAAVGPHMIVDIAAGGDAEIYVYEGATVSGGTGVTPTNRNRRSSNVSSVTLVRAPTVTATGTLIEQSFAPGGSGHKAGGGAGGFAGEFVLQYSTTYLVRVKNVSGSAQSINLNVWLYE